MNRPFVAVDIGNSTINAAVLRDTGERLPTDGAPTELHLAGRGEPFLSQLGDQACPWWAVSVNRDAFAQLKRWLASHRPDDELRLVTYEQATLELRVEFPDRVGMDRVAAAVAANVLRRESAAAVIVDSGTAITVDVVDRSGAFLGGAILPGVGMSAAALDNSTDALPRIIPLNSPPPSIGVNTEAAIHSGLFWGSFGAVKELIAQHRAALGGEVDLYLTGGAAVWSELLPDAILAPSLTLQGVAHMAMREQAR